jgi:signal transduction histidine kinase
MSTTPEPEQRDVRQRALAILAIQALLLVCAAVIAVGEAVLNGGGVVALLVALALVIAATIGWRARRSLATNLRESRAWAEVTAVRSRLAEREALWSTLPAPAAAWDSEGQLLMKTAAWQSTGLPTETPPNQQELSIGDPPRLFVVDSMDADSGARLVVLREVTRERLALQAKDELLAIVGHELRTPLSSIKGYGQLMARQLATVQDQVQRLDQLIQDVLDTAQVEGGRLSLRREPLSVDDLVRSACERFSAANQSRMLKQKLDAHGLIEGDPARLSQVMDNLLSNAARYSPADSPIVVRTHLDADWVRIDVVDRGVGIAAEHLPRLFDRFYRVPLRDSTATQGFGLGLSIVRDLVEAHGGHVSVASSGPGTGSTFTISLPITLPMSREPESADALASRQS